MNDETNLIEGENLRLSYDGFTAADGVNFTLGRGDYLCVVGENGSGKSTLMKAVTGEIRPSGGSLRIADKIKKTGIGYLPQQSKIQRDFPATAGEVVLSGCAARDKFGLLWREGSRKKAADAMKRLGIENLGCRCFGELSGGQRQRVLLARALCVSEKILLLDEPVTGLDPEAAHEMYRAIREINRSGCAVMMVTHDIMCAGREAKHILSMCRGHSFYGTVEEYFAHEELDEQEDRHFHDYPDSHEHE